MNTNSSSHKKKEKLSCLMKLGLQAWHQITEDSQEMISFKVVCDMFLIRQTQSFATSLVLN